MSSESEEVGLSRKSSDDILTNQYKNKRPANKIKI